MTITFKKTCVLLLAATSALATAVRAADDDPVIASNAAAQVRMSEFRQEIEQRVPPDLRPDFLSSKKRVGEIVSQILLRKTLATEAKAQKLDQKPENVARMNNEVERVLAQMRLAAIDEKAVAEFDAKLAQYEARARDIYLADRERYRVPESVSASHILFDTKKHSSEEARQLAAKTRERIVAGADFGAVAKEVSEDPTAAKNSGSLGWFTRDKMDPAFSMAVFAMKDVGSVSEPVQSSFGWHLIKLEGRREAGVQPFDQVRGDIVAEMRTKYVKDQREAVLDKIRDDPKTAYNEPVLDAYVMQARSTAAAGSAAKP